jgi:DNA-damage-inducible protein J
MEAIIKSRIDVDLKAEVESVLSALGMTVSDVMRITFAQIAARKGLPFDVKLPNAETLSALKESDAALARLRAGAKPRFNQLDDYFAAMDAKASKSVKPAMGKVAPKPQTPVRVSRATAR